MSINPVLRSQLKLKALKDAPHLSTAIIRLSIERIESAIFFIRGERVMLDSALADLYDVETKAVNRAVKRNLRRFPPDFMFQLTAEESADLRCQIGSSKGGRGGRRYRPFAFTEQGVAMLSTVLNSERAVLVNIEIMRAFVKLRRMLASNVDLRATEGTGEQVRPAIQSSL